MADQLNMNGLNLGPGQEAPNGPGGNRSYIPPHMRGKGMPPAAQAAPMAGGPPPGPPGGPGGPPMAAAGLNNSAWAG